MANTRALVFKTTDSGCFSVVSHKLNPDGYFRKGWIGGFHEMFHRTIWRYYNGDIPDGHEVHHKCNNRNCCNILHLELVEISAHKSQSNTDRYADIEANAHVYWLSVRCSGTALSATLNRSIGSCCRWIRKWNLQLQEI